MQTIQTIIILSADHKEDNEEEEERRRHEDNDQDHDDDCDDDSDGFGMYGAICMYEGIIEL